MTDILQRQLLLIAFAGGAITLLLVSGVAISRARPMLFLLQLGAVPFALLLLAGAVLFTRPKSLLYRIMLLASCSVSVLAAVTLFLRSKMG